jgi:hypothetical protein
MHMAHTLLTLVHTAKQPQIHHKVEGLHQESIRLSLFSWKNYFEYLEMSVSQARVSCPGATKQTCMYVSSVLLQSCIKSKSKLLYDWRFTANQSVLGQTPWEPRPETFFSTEPLRSQSYVSSSLTRGWVCLLWKGLPFVKCTYRTYSMLLKILPCALYTSPLPVQVLESR